MVEKWGNIPVITSGFCLSEIYIILVWCAFTTTATVFALIFKTKKNSGITKGKSVFVEFPF